MSAAVAASAWTAAIAACSWYGPSGARDSVCSDQLHSLLQQRAVPAEAVLLGQRDQRAVGALACAAARLGQQHQRQQPRDLAVCGQQRVRHPRQADRLARELAPLKPLAGRRGVALVEHQVEHVQHDAQARGALLLGRQFEAGAGVRDRRLGAADALSHRRLGHEERAGDLRGSQAPDGAQRERQLRRRRQRRMTAQEQHRQRVVLIGDVGAGRRLLDERGLLAAGPRRLGPQRVDQPPGGDGDQPAARIVRHALSRPLLRGRDQRLLGGVLSEVEAAVAPGDGGEDLGRELPQEPLAHSARRAA